MAEATGKLTPVSIPVPQALSVSGGTLSVLGTFDPLEAVVLTPVEPPAQIALGQHYIVWQAVDATGIVGQSVQTVSVVDTTPPAIFLNGAPQLRLVSGSPYADPGATAVDTVDGDLTAQILVSGSVNSSAPGDYALVYTATDSSGNGASVTRKVTVYSNDTTPPVVTAPPAITAEATAVLTPIALGTAIAVDGVDGPVIALPDRTGSFPLGRSQVTWTARDAAGNVGTAIQSVTVVDTTPPMITAPNAIDTYVAGPMPLFIGMATATDIFGAIVTNGAPATFPIGQTTVTWSATDPSGNRASATQSITLRLDKPPVAIPGPNQIVALNSTVKFNGSNSYDPDGTITQYEWSEGLVVLSNAAVFTKSDFTQGVHTITLKVIDDHDGWDSANITIDVRATANVPPSLSFDVPIDGLHVTDRWVQVSGTYQAPPNSGIAINGQVAATENGHFYLLVPLVAGENTLNAVLRTPSGATANVASKVTRDVPLPPVEVTADSLESVNNLTATFTVSNNGAADAIVSCSALAIDGTAPAGSSFVFTGAFPPGVWPLTVTATDPLGNITSQDFVVVVHDSYDMDATLRAIWSGMVASVSSGDRNSAAAYLTAGANKKYAAAFDALGTSVGDTFVSLTPIKSSMISTGFAEYATVRDNAGTRSLYLIYFIRDYDGVWRLDSM